MNEPAARCPVCASVSRADQLLRIRGRQTALHRCTQCGLYFFPEPDWLPAVHSDAVSELDIGLPRRCINLSRIVEAIVRAEGLGTRRHLDWGGGYGLLTRLLRDRGIDMRHHDPYAENLFAQGFEDELTGDFGCITASEVFEHVEDPVAVLGGMAAHTDLVIVSTVFVPDGLTDLRDWWYVGPSGQHITFYTPQAMRRLAARFDYHLTTNGTNGTSLHVLHRRPLSRLTRLVIRDVRCSPFLARGLRLKQRSVSLRNADAVVAVARGPHWPER